MSVQRKAAPASTESQELAYIEKLKLEEARFVQEAHASAPACASPLLVGGADSLSDPLFTDQLAAVEMVAAEMETGLKTLRAVGSGKPAAVAEGGLD